MLFSTLFAVGLLILDQITKILVESSLKLGERITVIPGFFDLTHITNKGAAWGILHGYGWLLLLIAAAVVVVAFLCIRWLTEGYNERYFAIFIVFSGIFGNSIDRIWRGQVVDFLDFYIYYNREHHWPAFNVADISICVGVGIYFLSTLLRSDKNSDNTADKLQETADSK
ncbi:signal peptidase II [Lentisphaerota bacterium ZTH]|nr:signal peptidase II [Lentisphaerota bacterium]WET06264.1 signal peptidase II [Lentisphaerota bacterium ZTH]